ncbi:MAG: c-type cytochrome [Bacteroidia bacterium]
MKKIAVLSIMGLFIFASSCGDSKTNKDQSETNESVKSEGSENTSKENPSYDPHRGEGKYSTVEISDKLNTQMADKGEKEYDVKCSACHKTTDEKLVGPGWQDVTKRRQPAWIMNFITNTDAMIDKDPQVQSMLELCLVRMPNQSLTDDEARNILEFMRKNDGVKP